MLWFGHQWSGRKGMIVGGFAGGCSLCSQNVSGIEEETNVSNNWIRF